MLNSVSVTPGWVAKTPGGKDEWLQHRVVTRLQFNFFNGNELVADPFFVDTHSIHGPVSATLPAEGPGLPRRGDHPAHRAAAGLAAADDQRAEPRTRRRRAGSRPAGWWTRWWAAPRTGRHAPADPVGGATSDPVDATFAMSQLQFFGHAPT